MTTMHRTLFTRHSHVMSSEYDNSFLALAVTREFIENFGGQIVGVGKMTVITLDSSNYDRAVEILNESGMIIPSEGFYIVHVGAVGIPVVFGYDTAQERNADFEEAELMD